MDTFEKAVEQIYNWQHCNTDSFYNNLCTLWMKADGSNKRRLQHGFPYLAEAMDAWNAAGNYGEDLFKAHGLGIGFVEELERI